MSPTTFPFLSPQNDSQAASPALSLEVLAAQCNAEDPPLRLYVAAVDCLVHWQTHTLADGWKAMDPAEVLRGLRDFGHWYLGVHRQGSLDVPALKVIDNALTTLTQQCLGWPHVPVHQSWVPCQLLQDQGGFSIASQGAGVMGPITYDIGTLVRDAKLVWEENFVLEVTIRYWERARKAGLAVGSDFGEFYRGVEWAALLQHLTQVGDLAHRAGTSNAPEHALSTHADAPVLLHYIRATCTRYIELKPFLRRG